MILCLLAAARPACRCSPKPAPSDGEHVAVPSIHEAMTIDGERDEPAWQHAFRSPAFEDSRGSKSPHSDVSILCGDEAIYVMTYVGDVDLRSKDDRIEMSLGRIKMQITPVTKELPGGITAAHDVDGTLDNPSDEDEEWIAEVAVPRSALGEGPFNFRAVHIDAGRSGPTRALAWPKDKEVVLDCTTSPSKS
jgi:hypothetical protein